MTAEAGPLSEQLDKHLPDATNQLMEHLRTLAESQPANAVASAVLE
jgi:hypothetical protein